LGLLDSALQKDAMNNLESSKQADRDTCSHKDENGKSTYKETYSDFDYESYECTLCGDRYKLWYEDMC